MNKSVIMGGNTRIEDINNQSIKVEPIVVTLVQSGKRNSLWIDIVLQKT